MNEDDTNDVDQIKQSIMEQIDKLASWEDLKEVSDYCHSKIVEFWEEKERNVEEDTQALEEDRKQCG